MLHTVLHGRRPDRPDTFRRRYRIAVALKSSLNQRRLPDERTHKESTVDRDHCGIESENVVPVSNDFA